MPSYHNPTSITMSSQRRQEISRIIKEQNITLIEDDTYWFELTATYKNCEKEVKSLNRKFKNLNQYLGRTESQKDVPKQPDKNNTPSADANKKTPSKNKKILADKTVFRQDNLKICKKTGMPKHSHFLNPLAKSTVLVYKILHRL